MWKLFLDDLRTPDEDCILARSVDEAVALIESKGFPVFISFDNDLGESVPEGQDFAKMIVDKVLDGEWEIPKNFRFEVHSDNPPANDSIKYTMNNFLNHLGIPFHLEKSTPYRTRRK